MTEKEKKLVEALKLIHIYTSTASASGYSSEFLSRLNEEFQPIKNEVKRVFKEVGVKL